MAIKFIFTSALSLIGSSILSAQTTAGWSAQTTAVWQAEQLAINTMNTVRLLEQNALMAIIGTVVLMGLMWICSVWKAYTKLSQSTQKHQSTLHNAFHFVTTYSNLYGPSFFNKKTIQ